MYLSQIRFTTRLFLEEILDVEDCGLLKGYEMRMLRSPEALASFLCECGELSCHTDPVFKQKCSGLLQICSKDAWSRARRLQLAL